MGLQNGLIRFRSIHFRLNYLYGVLRLKNTITHLRLNFRMNLPIFGSTCLKSALLLPFLSALFQFRTKKSRLGCLLQKYACHRGKSCCCEDVLSNGFPHSRKQTYPDSTPPWIVSEPDSDMIAVRRKIVADRLKKVLGKKKVKDNDS